MTSISFYFTQQDPNYRIKGSRDPLGFQRLWQQTGRHLIKYLSTVSSSIRDFQTLSFAWYFWGDRDPRHFLPFFLKFEQACGFTRDIYFPGTGFNGIDFVSKNKSNTSLTFSLKNQHTLLSNQRAYGIFGKYNRPFTDIGFVQDEQFQAILSSALAKTDRKKVEQLIGNLISREEVTVERNELEVLQPLLEALTTEERDLYRRKILRVEKADHIQNEFYHLLKNNPTLLEVSFNLQPFLQTFLRESLSDELREALIEIQHTEKVLYIYDAIFRTLQTEPNWTAEKLLEYPLFQNIPPRLNYAFRETEMSVLNEQLGHSPMELIQQIIKRNGDISRRRNHSAPWMEFEDKKKRVQIYYSEGKASIPEFKPDVEYGNSYFIETYLNLFRQIELTP